MFWTNFGMHDAGFTAAGATGRPWRGFLDARTTLDMPSGLDCPDHPASPPGRC